MDIFIHVLGRGELTMSTSIWSRKVGRIGGSSRSSSNLTEDDALPEGSAITSSTALCFPLALSLIGRGFGLHWITIGSISMGSEVVSATAGGKTGLPSDTQREVTEAGDVALMTVDGENLLIFNVDNRGSGSTLGRVGTDEVEGRHGSECPT
jgi:hypothetical protein